jgi:antitoxin StbD
MKPVLANYAVSISELRKNPSQLIEDAKGHTIVILNHNMPTAYLVSPDLYAQFLELLDDQKLTALIKKRLESGKKPIEIDIDDL